MDDNALIGGTHASAAHMNIPMTDSQRAMKRSAPETPVSRALRSAVNSVLEGTDAAAVAASHGLPVNVLDEAVASYREGGWGALNARVPRPGSVARRKLTREQEQELHQAVRSNLPDALGLRDRLWTKEAVHALVQERTGLVLPTRTLSAYLERWGFAPEKPLKFLYHLQPAGMRAWMKRDYPIVAMQAKEVGAQLYWWGHVPLVPRDRNRLYPSEHARPLWAPGTWNLLYVITNRGYMHWMVNPGELDGTILLEFLSRLQGTGRGPFHLLVQDHPLFASPSFIAWSLLNKEWIECHFVPVPNNNMLRSDTIG